MLGKPKYGIDWKQKANYLIEYFAFFSQETKRKDMGKSRE